MPKIKDSTRYGANYVYFIYEGFNNAHQAEIFKMGFSCDPKKRMSSLQTGNMRQLAIYRLIECPNRKFAQAIEYVLHKNFLSYNNRGEWFHITAKDIDYICSIVIELITSNLPLQYFEEIPLKHLVQKSSIKPKVKVFLETCENTGTLTVCSGLPDTNFQELTMNLSLNMNTNVEYKKAGVVNILLVKGDNVKLLENCLQVFMPDELHFKIN